MPDEQEAFPRLTGVPLQLTDWADKVADWNENHRPLSGVGTALTDGPGRGKQINVALTGLGSGGSLYTPFQVLTRVKPGGSKPPTYQFAVAWGELQRTQTPNDYATITGRPTSEEANDPTKLTWNDLSTLPDVAYIDITGIDITSPFPGSEAYAINSGSQGGTFDYTQIAWANANAYVSGTSDPIVTGVTDQDEACILIAYINQGDKGQPIVVPQVTTHLLLKYQWIDGSPAYFI
jgi:hypothetical protein